MKRLSLHRPNGVVTCVFDVQVCQLEVTLAIYGCLEPMGKDFLTVCQLCRASIQYMLMKLLILIPLLLLFYFIVIHERTERSVYEGVEIIGSSAFIARTQEALKLIDASGRKSMVRTHVARIREAKYSGMRAWELQPTFDVGERTWRYSAIWYAGTIVHDACHSRLYHEAKAMLKIEPPASAWMGSEAEKKCLKDQLPALVDMKAPPQVLQYVSGLMSNPVYQNQEHRDW